MFRIVLKAPGKECIQYSESCCSSRWTRHEDINEVLSCWFKYPTHWLIYNDETDTHVDNGAHAKGIVAWNDSEVSWMIHSVPKYPDTFDGALHPIEDSELIYGQSFLLCTFPIHQLKEVLTQVFIMKPYVYIHTDPYDEYKGLHKKIESRMFTFNKRFTHISKSPRNHKEFYSELLVPAFGACTTETWVRGHECEDTDTCKMAIEMKWNHYTYTRDHSKLAWSSRWVMVGDLNRMTSQVKRGGGGMIVKNVKLPYGQVENDGCWERFCYFIQMRPQYTYRWW